jgi:hypothetical protein
MAFMSEEAQDRIREQAGIVAPLTLMSILPDTAQPRQLLPADLSDGLAKGELTLAAALQAWMKRAAAEDAPPALRRNVQELQRLAESIAQHGLINPISVRRVPGHLVVPEGVKYLIITGERRYWAHVLLVSEERKIQEGVETNEPDRIKATIASEGISVRAHQILENLLREDIDAVEKATGFAALRQELSGRDPSTAEGEVNHGSPLVSWRQVENTLGVSKRYRIYVMSVLNLSDDAREIIREHGLTERMVRPISQKLRKQPDLQVQVLNRILAWQSKGEDGVDRPLTASVEALVDSLVVREERKLQRADAGDAAQKIGPQQLHNRLRAMLKALNSLGDSGVLSMAEALANNEANTAVVADLQKLEQQVTRLLEAIEARRADAE